MSCVLQQQVATSLILPQMHVLFIWTLYFADNWRVTTLFVLTVGHRALLHHDPYNTVPQAAKPAPQPGTVVW